MEANPELAANLASHPRLASSVLAAALVARSNPDGVEFNVSQNPQASSVDPLVAQSYGITKHVTVECIELHEILAKRQLPSLTLAKFDVEGAEIEVLLSASSEVLTSISQITVEFHDVFRPETRPEVCQVRTRLKALGFIELNANWPFTDDILFINRRSFPRNTRGLHLNLFMARILYMLRGAAVKFLRFIKVKRDV